MTPKSSASKSLWTLRGVIEIYYWNRYNCRRNVARKSHFGRWGVFSSILGMCVILIAFFPEMYTEVLETTGPRLRDLASGHEASLRNLGPILLRKSEVSARISEGQTVYTVIKVMPHTAHTTFCRNHPGQVCLPLIRNESDSHVISQSLEGKRASKYLPKCCYKYATYCILYMLG